MLKKTYFTKHTHTQMKLLGTFYIVCVQFHLSGIKSVIMETENFRCSVGAFKLIYYIVHYCYYY